MGRTRRSDLYVAIKEVDGTGRMPMVEESALSVGELQAPEEE